MSARVELAGADARLRLRATDGTEPVVRFDPHAGLPVASRTLDELYDEAVAGRSDGAAQMGWLRECRRALRPGARLFMRSRDLGDHEAVDALRRDAARLTGLVMDEPCAESGRLVFRRPERPAVPRHPLVSILIAAYRSRWLDEALQSARAQTWTGLEIVVGDDCPDDTVAEVVRRHAAEDARVRYHRNHPQRGARANYYGLFQHARGELIKYLNDDDVLHPDAVRRMAAVLGRCPDVTLVSSHRRNIDEISNTLPDDAPTRPMFDADVIVPGSTAIGLVFGANVNWIGEPSTTMFRRCDIDDSESELFAFSGRPALANGDLTLWTRLLAAGDLCYLATTLSRFRRHGGQCQAGTEFRERALLGWRQLQGDAESAGMSGPSIRFPMALLLEDRPWWDERTRQCVAAATTSLAAGDYERAFDHLVAAAAGSGEADLRVRAALAALDGGCADAAREQLRSAVDLDPWDARPPALLALVSAMVGDLATARLARSRAAERAPGSDLVAEVDAAIGSALAAV